jgi:hypothetical protein
MKEKRTNKVEVEVVEEVSYGRDQRYKTSGNHGPCDTRLPQVADDCQESVHNSIYKIGTQRPT